MTDETKKQEDEVVEEDVSQEPLEESPKTPQEQAEEYLAGWKRARADYDNLKKEMDQKSKDWIDVGIMRVVQGIIPVYNNFCSAVEHIPPDQQSVPWVVGVMYIKQNLEEVFKELDLEIIPTVGQPFDEELHEAVDELPSEVTDGVLTVVRQVSVGFTKNGKILVPAKVVVTKQ